MVQWAKHTERSSDMHGSATTTSEIRQAIQTSALSIRTLAARYGVNPKTIVKWKTRLSVQDLPMGPHQARQKALTPTEEATCVAFRIQAMLPLDDCLYALQLMFPHLMRSTLHRLFQRHGIHRLPSTPNLKPDRTAQRAKIGHFYIDAADIRTGTGRANMIFSFDRVSKIAFARLYNHSKPANGSAFLGELIGAVPYKIQSVLTGTGGQFTPQQPVRDGTADIRPYHPFEAACRDLKINHQLLPPDQPWGQISAIKAPLPGSSTPGVHYESHDDLREHFLAFFDTYNFDRRLKTLRGLTPFEFVCQCWKEDPAHFHYDPHSYARMLAG